MKKFEYKQEAINFHEYPIKGLNELGKFGWEVVSIDDRPICDVYRKVWLKREIEE